MYIHTDAYVHIVLYVCSLCPGVGVVYPTGSNLVSVVVAVELYVRVRFAGRIWRLDNLGFEFQKLHFAILLVKVCFCFFLIFGC